MLFLCRMPADGGEFDSIYVGGGEHRTLMSQNPHSPARNWLLYDGDCPFCSRYVNYVRLRDAVGSVALLDAREHPNEVNEVRAHGMEIDTGMVLKLDDRYYHGADCLNVLALLTTSAGVFNRINRTLFRSRTVSRIAYPVLRAGRNLTLRLLGRSRMQPSHSP